MDEKILIKSEKYDLTKLIKIFLIIGIIASVVIFILLNTSLVNIYNGDKEDYITHSDRGYCYNSFNPDKLCYSCKNIQNSPSVIIHLIKELPLTLLLSLIPIPSMALIGAFIFFMFRSYELTVTDKRIYGKVAFGKRVDLPVDSVSATSTKQLMKGVAVSTASGKISFLAIKNANEVYSVINNLLIDRQHQKPNNTYSTETPVKNDIEDLKKLKELLDMGIISQEEFDAKKKQLLNL